MILVMLINVVYDIACGNAPLSFFEIAIKNGALYGRLVDVLNRGSEVAILAIGMTLVVSSSAGTDISVGSVMSLSGGFRTGMRHISNRAGAMYREARDSGSALQGLC